MNHTQRLELIKEAVIYCHKASRMGMPSNCYTKALREPVFFLWELRNTNKKYEAAMYRSENAQGLAAGNGKLIFDHAVPFNYLQKELLALKSVTTETIQKILLAHGIACLITKEEDQLLNKAGLGRKMPDDWDGSDFLARYRAVEINVIPNPDYKAEQTADENASRSTA